MNWDKIKIIGKFLIGYIVTGSALIFVIPQLGKPFPLSPDDINLIESLSVIIWIVLLPSIVIYKYYETDEISLSSIPFFSKILISINVLFTCVFLGFYLSSNLNTGDKNMVTIEDEFGKTSIVKIVNEQYIKNVLIFVFDNDSQDTTKNWLQKGFLEACDVDLMQDQYVNLISANDFVTNLGFQYDDVIPLSKKMKIAKEKSIPYFMSGSYSFNKDSILISWNLYDTQKGTVICNNTIKNHNFFNLIDDISLELKSCLALSEKYVNETIDLPVSSQLTESIIAFEYYIKALLAREDNNYQTALDLLNKAVQEDPYFTWAYFNSGPLYSYTNKMDSLHVSVKNTIDNIERLPPHKRYEIKYIYYTFNKEPNKVFTVLKNWVTQYPNTIDGHKKIARYYLDGENFDDAIDHHYKILEIDSLTYGSFYSISDLYKKNGDYNESIFYGKKYLDATEYSDVNGYIHLGNVFQSMGELDSAKVYYEQAEFMSPLNFRVQQSLVKLNSVFGVDIKSDYYNLLSFCKSNKDSIATFNLLIDYYRLKGQLNQAIVLKDSVVSCCVNHTYQKSKLDEIKHRWGMLLDLGEINTVFENISQFEIEFNFNIDSLFKPNYLGTDNFSAFSDNVKTHIGQIFLHESLDASYVKYVKSYINYIDNYYKPNYTQYSLGELEPLLKARIAFFENNYEQAISILESNNNVERTVDYFITLARYCHFQENFVKSKDYLDYALQRTPHNPKAHYYMALLLHDWNKEEQAIYHLNYAANIWKFADKDYIYYNLLKSTASEWDVM